MSCHYEDKFFEYDFEGFSTVLSTKGDKIHGRISNGYREILDTFFPREDHTVDLELSHCPQIILNNSSVITTISFLKNGSKKSEIGINYLTKRISFIKDFKDTKIGGKVIGTLPPKKEDTKLVYFSTETDQELYVPYDAKEVIIECWGAGGATMGSSNGTDTYNTGYGGGGAYVKASILDAFNKKFKIVVGEAGNSYNAPTTIPSGTYGGGGSSSSSGAWGGASAGGRSAVQIEINGEYEDIITAGGGGAGGFNGYSGEFYGLGSGGAGGTDTADSGKTAKGMPIYGGGGGSIYNGGAAGYSTSGSSNPGIEYFGGSGTYGGGGGSGFNGGGSGGAVTFDPPEQSIADLTKPTKETIGTPTIWLDASDFSSITQAGGIVSEWKDKSKSGLTFTPFFGNSQYSADGFNGKPCLHFPNTILSSDLPAGTFDEGITCFVVTKQNNCNTYNGIGPFRTDPGNTDLAAPFDIYNNARYCGFLNNESTNFTSSNIPSDFLVYAFQMSSTQAFNEWVNNELLSTNSSIITDYQDTGSSFQIGGRADQQVFANGVIAEILVYDTYLPGSKINAINLYLKKKWAIEDVIESLGLTITNPGNYWLFGGGGGGCSFVNSTYSRQIESLKGNKFKVGGEDKVPSEFKDRIGNGGPATCRLNDGKHGQSGLVVVTIKH